MITVKNCGALLHGCIGTGAGLGEREGAELFACCERSKVLCLLLFGTELHDGPAAQRCVCRENDRGGGANLCQLLNRQNIADLIDTCAAQVLGNGKTHHAHLSHLLYGLDGETLGLVYFLCKRLYFVLCKFLKACLKFKMLCIKFKHSNTFLSNW